MYYLIDNFDSFTFNLVQYLRALGAELRVVRNNERHPADIIAEAPDGIVMSPGPCGPGKAGICTDLTLAAVQSRTPLLGVCLGHQVIGHALGGKIIPCAQIVHGKTSQIFHSSTGILEGVPSPFLGTRYHSLIVDRQTLPECLEVNGWLDDGTIMSFRHTGLPIYGVQFHPESIASEHGMKILKRFLNLSGSRPNG